MQFIVNTNLLREIDEREFLKAYARLVYTGDLDVTDDATIRVNLIELMDWEKNGSAGLGIYCGKFEKLKEKDFIMLIDKIKEYKEFIIGESKNSTRKLPHKKEKAIKLETFKKGDRYKDVNYEPSNRGKLARPCIYEGREYRSRTECMAKEGLTQNKLYRYLERTGQV